MHIPLDSAYFNDPSADVLTRAARIRLVLTDCDGVLTDAGVFYGENGEAFKQFNIRDGMGVVRLRDELRIETGIITGERSGSVRTRAEKLNIQELHLGVAHKAPLLNELIARIGIHTSQIAYIGDDVNDWDILQMVGLAACPADALPQIQDVVHYVCQRPGGHGAFRELAELIISAHALPPTP